MQVQCCEGGSAAQKGQSWELKRRQVCLKKGLSTVEDNERHSLKTEGQAVWEEKNEGQALWCEHWRARDTQALKQQERKALLRQGAGCAPG